MAETDKKPNRNYSYESARVMSVAFELGFIIALPIVLFGLGGKWLDTKYGTGYYIYIGIPLAIILTSFWMYSRFKAFIDKLKEAARIVGKDTEKK
ncbi:MAG: AtpZ/AtpI family protein [Patescibacteria group bacterium]